MNDRFKFRIWHKPTKTMEYNGLWTGYPNIQKKMSDNNFIIMQCTGITDKNGKLIYEGDVLKNLLNGKKYKVEWVGCQASFELHQILSPNDEGYKKAQPIAIYFANGGFQRFQVLGNIYENPELLDVKND